MPRWLTATLLAGSALAAFWILRTRQPPAEQYTVALRLLRDGDFEGAAVMATRAEHHSDTPEWRSRFRLLRVEALLEAGKGEEAVALLQPSLCASVESSVRCRALRARRLIATLKLEAARDLLAEARRIAVENARPDLQAEVELLLGQTLGRQRRLPDAEAMFLSARAAALTARDPYREGAAVNNLGMIQMIRSHCDEAIPRFQEAEQLYREAGANHWVAAARNNIGLCYSQLGDLDNALTFRQAALGLSRSSVLKANALGETGTVLLATNPARAVPYYRQARDMAHRFGALPDAARWAGNLAFALAEEGSWDEADAALRDARQLGPEPRSRVFLDLTAASIARGRGRPEEARAIYESAIASSPDNPTVLWQAHAGIAAAWNAENRTEEAIRSFEAAIRVVEGTQADLSRNEHKLTFLARLIRVYRDYVDLLMACNEPVRALAVSDRSRARLLAERISRRTGRSAEQPDEDFRAVAKRSGGIWLAYWIAPKRSFLWVVTAGEVRVFTLPPEADIRSLVEEYRAFVESGMRDPLRTPSDAGRRLYEVLIAPAAAMLTKGSRVMVVPDGPLHQLSLDTLPVYAGSEPRYLMDDVVLAVAPSFSIYGKSPTPAPGRDALLIGDPVAATPAFPPLRYAGREIANIAREMQPRRTIVITREAARPDVWKTSDPGRFGTIHVAAHAEANERSPLDSAIILSPGIGYRLYARDIIDVPLQADLVSLSACRSSGARTYAGEGLVGFAWAFLHAGARSVIAGLWDVADESTSMLMDALYARVAAGDRPAEALRSAKLSLRRTAYAKPYYWGAFQCYVR